MTNYILRCTLDFVVYSDIESEFGKKIDKKFDELMMEGDKECKN